MLFRTYRSVVAALACALSLAGAFAQSPTPVKLTLDWTFEGSHVPFAMTQSKGYFEKNGLKVQIDRGYGSGDTISKVAAGAYDVGYADINVLIKYNQDNPTNQVTCVFLLYDTTMNVVLARKDAGIEKPADLMGKRIAAPAYDNSRLLFPLYAQAAGIDASKVVWMSVQSNVRDAMLVRGETDSVAAVETAKLAMYGLGLPEDKLTVLRFSTYLPDLMGRGIMVSQKTIKEKPEMIRAFLKALTAGTKDAVADPQAATEALAKMDSLTKVPLELARFKLNVDESLLSKNVLANGISYVTPARAKTSFAVVAKAMDIPAPTDIDKYYDGSFLPSAAERKMK